MKFHVWFSRIIDETRGKKVLREIQKREFLDWGSLLLRGGVVGKCKKSARLDEAKTCSLRTEHTHCSYWLPRSFLLRHPFPSPLSARFLLVIPSDAYDSHVFTPS